MLRRVLFLLVAAALVACRSSDAREGPGTGSPELLVFAAASLTDVFGDLEEEFERQHADVSVTVSFAGSQSLRTQIEAGAQPQIFTSADEKHMAALRDQQLVDEPVVFVQNELVIVVPAENPANIRSFADLVKAERLVLAGRHVPVGSYAERVIESASRSGAYGPDFADRVEQRVVSRENHVRLALQKVVLGEADAAVVYATDARAAGDKVKTIAIPPEHNVIANYPIATVAGAAHARLAGELLAFILSEEADARFKEFGFRPVKTRQ